MEKNQMLFYSQIYKYNFRSDCFCFLFLAAIIYSYLNQTNAFGCYSPVSCPYVPSAVVLALVCCRLCHRPCSSRRHQSFAIVCCAHFPKWHDVAPQQYATVYRYSEVCSVSLCIFAVRVPSNDVMWYIAAPHTATGGAYNNKNRLSDV